MVVPPYTSPRLTHAALLASQLGASSRLPPQEHNGEQQHLHHNHQYHHSHHDQQQEQQHHGYHDDVGSIASGWSAVDQLEAENRLAAQKLEVTRMTMARLRTNRFAQVERLAEDARRDAEEQRLAAAQREADRIAAAQAEAEAQQAAVAAAAATRAQADEERRLAAAQEMSARMAAAKLEDENRLAEAAVQAAEAANAEAACAAENERVRAAKQEAERAAAAHLEAERLREEQRLAAAQREAARLAAAHLEEKNRLAAVAEEEAKLAADEEARLVAAHREAARLSAIRVEEENRRAASAARAVQAAADEDARLAAAQREAARIVAAAKAAEDARIAVAQAEADQLAAAKLEDDNRKAVAAAAQAAEEARLAAAQQEAIRVQAAKLEDENRKAVAAAAAAENEARLVAAQQEAARLAVARQEEENRKAAAAEAAAAAAALDAARSAAAAAQREVDRLAAAQRKTSRGGQYGAGAAAAVFAEHEAVTAAAARAAASERAAAEAAAVATAAATKRESEVVREVARKAAERAAEGERARRAAAELSAALHAAEEAAMLAAAKRNAEQAVADAAKVDRERAVAAAAAAAAAAAELQQEAERLAAAAKADEEARRAVSAHRQAAEQAAARVAAEARQSADAAAALKAERAAAAHAAENLRLLEAQRHASRRAAEKLEEETQAAAAAAAAAAAEAARGTERVAQAAAAAAERRRDTAVREAEADWASVALNAELAKAGVPASSVTATTAAATAAVPLVQTPADPAPYAPSSMEHDMLSQYLGHSNVDGVLRNGSSGASGSEDGDEVARALELEWGSGIGGTGDPGGPDADVSYGFASDVGSSTHMMEWGTRDLASMKKPLPEVGEAAAAAEVAEANSTVGQPPALGMSAQGVALFAGADPTSPSYESYGFGSSLHLPSDPRSSSPPALAMPQFSAGPASATAASGGTSNGSNGFEVVFASSKIAKPTASVQKIIRTDLIHSRRQIPLSGSLIGSLPISITFEKATKRGEPRPTSRQKADVAVQIWGVCRDAQEQQQITAAPTATTVPDGGVPEFWLVATNPFDGKGHTRVYQHSSMTKTSMSSRPMDSQKVYGYLTTLVRIVPVGGPAPAWAAALLRGMDARVAQGLLSEDESPDIAAALVRNAVEILRGPEIADHEFSKLHLVFDHALSLEPSRVYFKAGKYPCTAYQSSGAAAASAASAAGNVDGVGSDLQSIDEFVRRYPECRSTALIGITLWRLPYGCTTNANIAAQGRSGGSGVGSCVPAAGGGAGDGLSLADLETMLNNVDADVEADISSGMEGHLASLLDGVHSAISDGTWRDAFVAAEQNGQGQAAIEAVFESVGKGYILDRHAKQLQSEKATLYNRLRHELIEPPTSAPAIQNGIARGAAGSAIPVIVSGGAVFG